MCAMPETASAARLLRFTIEVDGKPVLEGIASDRGTEPPAEVWLNWGTAALESQDQTLLPLTTTDAASSRLTGNIVLTARHSDRILGQARVDAVELVRRPEAGGAWALAPQEVSRTAIAAGLPPMPSKSSDSVMRRLIQIVAAGGLVLLVLGAIAVLRKARKTETVAPG